MKRTRIDSATLRQTVLAVLRGVAPEVSPDALQPGKPLRNQVDLDSMDWLNFIVALNERLGVDIPEEDYAKLVTLDDLLGYLARKR
jgi:acyl carrier protein